MRKKPQLLAPAGDLAKLKIAVIYGADAVYIGGKNFSLRAKASNFELSDILEGVEFAHAHKAKLYVTVNAYAHQSDLAGLDEYLTALDECGVDAIIASSLCIIQAAIRLKCNFEIHVSTQQSCANSEALRFWQSIGCKRVVLARECTLPEIKIMQNKKIIDLEVFIHGGLCSSYSGRCALSSNMTNRDANRGSCAHSCRWVYDLYLEGKKINADESKFRIGSKDLQGITKIKELMDIGVHSLKIEGRMKSLHYIATIVSTYRKAIDEYARQEEASGNYMAELEKAENRETTLGYLQGDISHLDLIYSCIDKTASQEFIGMILDYNPNNQLAKILRKNHFGLNQMAEILRYDGNSFCFLIEEIYDEDMNPVEVAKHSEQILYLKIPFAVKKDYILRKINKEEY